MFFDLLNAHRPCLDMLAEAWLATGARSFSLWSEGQRIASWGAEITEPGDLVEEIRPGDFSLGEARVGIASTAEAQARLRADAALIASLVPLTSSLTQVTSELIETRDQILMLYQLVQACQHCLEPQSVLDTLAQELPDLFKTENAFVILHAGEKSMLTAQHPQPLFSCPTLYDLFERARKGGLAILSGEEISGQVGNLLLVPVGLRGERSAAIGLVNKCDGEFMSPDIKLARAVVGYAGSLMENSLMIQAQMELARMQTEMELARRVQLSLLPKVPPKTPGLEMWAASRPALHVGGDFFDFIVQPGQQLTLVVGDLSGKGFPAALLMSMTRTVIRTELHGNSTPEHILAETNRELYEDFNRLSSFATLFVGQYNPSLHQLRFANAGHSPVIHRPAGGKARLLQADGTALGILPVSMSKDQCMQFHKDDLLIVGTDGLYDAVNPEGERLGYEHLLSMVDALAERPTVEIANTIYEAVNQFSAGNPPSDDQTLVVVKCTGL